MTDRWMTRTTRSRLCPQEGRGSALLTWRLRKRLRNRQAAAKCRKRKLERISLLDDRVAQLKTENADLAAVVKKMKSSVASLKQEVLDHVNSGCEIRMSEATVFS